MAIRRSTRDDGNRSRAARPQPRRQLLSSTKHSGDRTHERPRYDGVPGNKSAQLGYSFPQSGDPQESVAALAKMLDLKASMKDIRFNQKGDVPFEHFEFLWNQYRYLYKVTQEALSQRTKEM